MNLTLKKGTIILYLGSGIAFALVNDAEIITTTDVPRDILAEHLAASGRTDLLEGLTHVDEEKNVIVSYSPHGGRIESPVEDVQISDPVKEQTGEQEQLRTERLRADLKARTVVALKETAKFFQLSIPLGAKEDEIIELLISHIPHDDLESKIAEK